MKILLGLLALVVIVAVYNVWRPLPQNISFLGRLHQVRDVRFLTDLTFMSDGKRVSEQQIFQEMCALVEGAERFVHVDMFLLNDEYDRKNCYPDLAETFVATLIRKKQQQPRVKISLITDEINTFYGSRPSPHLERLQAAGIDVILTNMLPLRDSNPLFSAVWRIFLQWFGTSGRGWIASPFSPDSPKVTLRSFLNLFNFKANHRKLLVTDKAALISSANIHDASGYHSNIGFVVTGPVLEDILTAEAAVAQMSGGQLAVRPEKSASEQGFYQVRFLTEGKIRQALVDAVNRAKKGDTVWLAMFYLSEKEVLQALEAAVARSVRVRLILDPNKDAFGREKGGIPNRGVARRLAAADGDLQIRWYATHGEQFHTKLAFVKYAQECFIMGGSANMTRRNVGDYNLEADLAVTAPVNSKLVTQVNAYLEKIWQNPGGSYTLEYGTYSATSCWKQWLGSFQEWSGMGSF